MYHKIKQFLFLILICLALGLFWFFLTFNPTTAITAQSQTKLQCLSYAPFGKDESPMDFDKGLKLSYERMDQDLALLAQYTNCIRTYSTLGLEKIPEIARKHGLKMWLGAWVSSDPTLTHKEINAMIALAKQNADIVETVVVGNEALLRRDVSPSQLIAYIQSVKKELPHTTVTYADVWEFWNQHPDVAPVVDRITIHILPYWEDKPIRVDQSLLHVKNIYALMKQKFSTKEIAIGETGWPSFGRMREGALPSAENQAFFTREFVQLAQKEGWKYNFIEAFDQPWKRVSEGAVGGYWGLFDANRMDKHILQGTANNYPHALWLFIGSVILALLGVWYAFSSPKRHCKKGLPLFLTLFGGSVALMWQANSYYFTARTLFEGAWAVMTLIVAWVLWMRLLRFMAENRYEPYGNLAHAIALLLNQTTPYDGVSKGIHLLHLLSITLVLIIGLGMAFDGRYHNFDIGILGIIAFFYAMVSFKNKGMPQSYTNLEHISGLILFACASTVLIQEGVHNTMALAWEAALFVLASALYFWKVRVKRFLLPFVILLVSGIGFVILKNNVYTNEALIDVCAANSSLIICQVRAILGKLIYLNIIGMAGVAIAILSLLVRSYWLGMLAMVLGLFCLLTFNGFMGAMAMVLGGWVVGYHASKCFNEML